MKFLRGFSKIVSPSITKALNILKLDDRIQEEGQVGWFRMAR